MTWGLWLDGVAAAAALPQYMPVLEPVDDGFDASPDPAEHPVMVVEDDDPAGVSRRGVTSGLDAADVYLSGGNPLIQLSQYLIAGFSQPQNIEAVRTLAVGWVKDMSAGTQDGIYGAPQEIIQIETDAGTATAVVLPLESAQVSPIDTLLQSLLDFAARTFFVFEPLAGQPSSTATATAV